MNPIIAPVDFSDNSRHSMEYAGLLAKTWNTRLQVINIPQYPMTIGENPMPLSVVREIDLSALNQLQNWQKQLESALDYNDIHISLEYGGVANSIDDKARATHADLIVIASHSHEETMDFLLGSVTDSVIHHTKTPTLCIPLGSSSKLPARIVFATEFGNSDIDCINHIIPMAEACNAFIEVVHVDGEHNDKAGAFKQHIANLATVTRITYQGLEAGNVENTLYNYAVQHPDSWLAVNRRYHTMFTRLFDRSVTSRLLRQSSIPLLVYNVHD
jgi:nucleotide-binding universal stress UspA family protein